MTRTLSQITETSSGWRRTFLRVALPALALLWCAVCYADLTPSQVTTFRTALLAETDPALVAARTSGQVGVIRAWYSQPATPAFQIWRWDVTAEETGNAWVGTDIDGMSALNMQRLQLLLASAPSGIFDMTRTDRRAGFENPFGTNQNNGSRVAMRSAWQRAATRIEKLFSSGTGTVASPGDTVIRSPLTEDDVRAALFP
jgi:hypothetical protein